MNEFQDSFSEEIWRTTYKDHKDTTLSDTFRRVAKSIASAEKTPEKQAEWEEKFYDMLSDFKTVAGGRIQANAGTEWSKVTLLNCYVGSLPNQDLDSIEGIYAVLKDQANTLKSEGGWGMNFSWIRPRTAFIAGVGVESPGSVRFMELFDKSSEIVTSGSGKQSSNKTAKQKIRKGAMMSCLDSWHPDLIEFITAKQTPGRLTKFNVSVNCTDEFMDKVNQVTELSKLKPSEVIDGQGSTVADLLAEADKWDLIFPDTTHPQYKAEWDGNIALWKSKGYPVIVYQTVSVRWLWNLIMESTYNRNEPGVLFLDRANYFAPLSYAERVMSVNPCGEQTLAPGGVCCLGTTNLTQFVDVEPGGFDLDRLKKYAGYLVRFLDNVNDVSDAPLESYKHSMSEKRRIGCGVMGWGSALFMLRIRFGSEEAIKLQEELMNAYAKATYEASIDLAVEKGMFSYCDPLKHAEGPFIKSLGLSEEYLQKLRTTGIRNSSLMSQQPNGNTSIEANIVSGGIEPVFMPEYIRTKIETFPPSEIAAVTPKYNEGVFEETSFFKWDKEGDDLILKGITPEGVVYKIDRNRGLTREVLCEDYGVRYLKSVGKWDPKADWMVTTTELTAQDHVNDLRGFARWTDSACSKCVEIGTTMVVVDNRVVYLEDLPFGEEDTFNPFSGGTLDHTGKQSSIKSTYYNGVVDGVKLTFSDRSTLTSTLTHRVYTDTRGFVRADELVVGDSV
jgi:ribonucleoside-diphosphate reductase alpha chain